MCVRFDSSTDALTRTTNLPAITSFTIMGWVKISVDRNATSTFFQMGASTADGYSLRTFTDGVLFQTSNGTGTNSGSTLTVGTWYHMAFSVSGTAGSNFLVYLNGVIDQGQNCETNAAGTFRIGNSSDSLWLNGCAHNVLIYSAILTAAEINKQRWHARPQRTLNLNGWYPMVGTTAAECAVDYSGSGNNMTVGGTPVVEPGPPLLWHGTKRRRLHVVSSAPSATLLDVDGSLGVSGEMLRDASQVLAGAL